MKFRLAAISALTLSNFCSTASCLAADWSNIAQGANSTIFIDTSSIQRNGQIVRYWTRTENVKAKNGWKADVTLEESNCATGQKRYIQITIYREDGTIDTTSTAGEWRYAVPETIGYSVLQYVCGS